MPAYSFLLCFGVLPDSFYIIHHPVSFVNTFFKSFSVFLHFFLYGIFSNVRLEKWEGCQTDPSLQSGAGCGILVSPGEEQEKKS